MLRRQLRHWPRERISGVRVAPTGNEREKNRRAHALGGDTPRGPTPPDRGGRAPVGGGGAVDHAASRRQAGAQAGTNGRLVETNGRPVETIAAGGTAGQEGGGGSSASGRRAPSQAAGVGDRDRAAREAAARPRQDRDRRTHRSPRDDAGGGPRSPAALPAPPSRGGG